MRSYLKDKNSLSNLKRVINLYVEWKNWKKLDDLILRNNDSKRLYEKSYDILLTIGNSYFSRDYLLALNFYEKAIKVNNNLREPHLRIA